MLNRTQKFSTTLEHCLQNLAANIRFWMKGPKIFLFSKRFVKCSQRKDKSNFFANHREKSPISPEEKIRQGESHRVSPVSVFFDRFFTQHQEKKHRISKLEYIDI